MRRQDAKPEPMPRGHSFRFLENNSEKSQGQFLETDHAHSDEHPKIFNEDFLDFKKVRILTL